MPISKNKTPLTKDKLLNPLNIYEVNPIIFYSGKEDELNIELVEFNHGELIIKSLSTDILKVKELIMEDEDFDIKWKQTTKGLRITLPDGLINDEFRQKCTLKIKF
ncbi:hypothetical protein EZ449_16290 [Pedobacter frigidisoli]|uniref:Uncharacterized protein n=1 Tax=Pedobacter frigidisoli TaxID=2530455 RepID=A0A4R0P0D1_9SPHI|nr:hypothetical protein [Pedobacter frigidisoli]TCD05646.1 hypothetical protein EZ449_16290 [Pedobacter frigidisoli]